MPDDAIPEWGEEDALSRSGADYDDAVVASDDSMTASSPVTAEGGNATTVETNEDVGTTRGVDCHINAVADDATDDSQPSRQGDDSIVSTAGDLIVPGDIDSAVRIEGVTDIESEGCEVSGEGNEGGVEYAPVEEDVRQLARSGTASVSYEVKEMDVTEMNEPVIKPSTGGEASNVDGEVSVEKDEESNTQNASQDSDPDVPQLGLPGTASAPYEAEGVDLSGMDGSVTKSSTEDDSNIDGEILTENDEDIIAQNAPLDADPDGSHAGGKQGTGDENDNTGSKEDPTAELSADANVNESDHIDDDALMGDAVGQTERMQSIAAAEDSTNSTEDKDSNTKDGLDMELTNDDCLTLSIVTWNLGEAEPSEEEASFFRRFRGSDLVMIGAQECEEIKPRRTEGRRSRHLRRTSIMMLGENYVPLAIHSLGGIQCALFCHRNVLGDVEMIDLVDVTCGVGGVFHNKGAIGIYLKLKRRATDENPSKTSRILLVTGHLAAHVKNVDARNGDFKRIVSELEAQAPARFLRPRKNADGSPAECDGAHLLSSMDHVFFAGDLNYRIDLPREYVERCIIDVQRCRLKDELGRADVLMGNLLRRDQLLQTMASGRAFSNFYEGQVTFLPTFKFDKGTSNYDTSHKQRVPAWTDRIVFRSNKVSVLEYNSAAEARHSDHRPVFGTFKLGWRMSDNLSNKLKTKRTRARRNGDSGGTDRR